MVVWFLGVVIVVARPVGGGHRQLPRRTLRPNALQSQALKPSRPRVLGRRAFFSRASVFLANFFGRFGV